MLKGIWGLDTGAPRRDLAECFDRVFARRSGGVPEYHLAYA